ncbi:MAG: phosphoethanolamine--lipid A transferase [Arcobacteraceae bacterium]
MQKTAQYRLIIIVSFIFTLFYNFSFFRNVIEIYPLNGMNIIYLLSIYMTLFLFIAFIFSLLASKYTTKPVLIISLLISSFTAYFMDTYHVIIDYSMIQNSLQTNLKESLDLFSLELVFYILFLGVLPSFYVYKTKLVYASLKLELFTKLKFLLLSLGLIVVIILSFSQFYTSFFREHKSLKYHANPSFWFYSIINYTKKSFTSGKIILQPLGEDAKINETPEDKKELIILVVGEATRADRFSLNGYARQTNPLLEKEDIVNFSNMRSCGTSTAHSVPCMFSIYTKDEYSYKKGITTENILDVLTRTNEVNILWRDNNSDSKNVALRVKYENFQTSKTNSICEEDGECRDIGMLIGLGDFIQQSHQKDVLIVLHQMGNHGPAYYKRYPKEFEKFTPVCKTNQLEKCTQEEVSNAYDNAILHTDYFLSEVIKFLKPYSKTHETAMIYMADHGESLGENGLYLHGLPYFMAPDSQTHVASLLWLSKEFQEEFDMEQLHAYKSNAFSQDNLFHTLLGLFEVQTDVYQPALDILDKARKPEHKAHQ